MILYAIKNIASGDWLRNNMHEIILFLSRMSAQNYIDTHFNDREKWSVEKFNR